MAHPVVVVPLDGSKNALSALPVARGLADLAKATVRIVHVTEATQPIGQTAQSLGLAAGELRGATLEVRGGAPAEAILAAAASREARLIVMTAYSVDARPSAVIGDEAAAVLGGARCPVVLVDPARAAESWALKRLLATHDGSPTVTNTIRPAAELAREAGAELVVLHLAADAEDRETGSIAPPRYIDQLQHGWPAWSDEFLARVACGCSLADVRVRVLMGQGEPAAETIRVAGDESADLVLVAWNGRWEAPHGDALKAVLQGAPCPVMVTRVA